MESYTLDIASLYSIREELPRPCRRKLISCRLQDGIVLGSTGVRYVSSSLPEHVKTSLYFPVLDAMLSELDRRFTDKNL